jgi:hypothetical protein
MKWNDIKNGLPTKIPEWYLQTHDCSGGTSCLVFGYDIFNFYPRYEVVHINDIFSVKGLIITHWMKIERP